MSNINNVQNTEVVVETKKRGRPAGAYNKKTIEAASALNMEPAQYLEHLKAEKKAMGSGKRGRPAGTLSEKTIAILAHYGLNAEQWRSLNKAIKEGQVDVDSEDCYEEESA